MEDNSTGLDGTGKSKQRKPYTIKKQREVWTDEEHEKFLEALRL
jgi:ribosome modulation factor